MQQQSQADIQFTQLLRKQSRPRLGRLIVLALALIAIIEAYYVLHPKIYLTIRNNNNVPLQNLNVEAGGNNYDIALVKPGKSKTISISTLHESSIILNKDGKAYDTNTYIPSGKHQYILIKYENGSFSKENQRERLF